MFHVLGADSSDSAAQNLVTLAGFAGIESRFITAPDGGRRPGEPLHCAATGRSLHAFVSAPDSKEWLLRELATPGSSLFLYAGATEPAVAATVRSIVPEVTGIRQVDAADVEFQIPDDVSDGLASFAGLSFGPVDRSTHIFDLLASGPFPSTLVSVNGAACCVKLPRGRTSIFLTGCEAPLDIDAPATKTETLLGRFLSFVPFLAYLKTTFGSQCWHNPQPAASVIIDDPLLKPRYGFLDFGKLEAAIDRSSFATTIAFIPWNFRRSSPAVARRFKRADRRLSVCVHGCDHTGAEFGSTDPDMLRSRASRAMRSMETHQQLTGIAHSPVMVFPQGVFSKASLKALEQEGFSAAVNTTVHPVDAADGEIRFRDLMSVAVVRFDGVPVFMRHYPGQPARFALDLFLGRPVLMVEHHSFFKNGYDTVEWYASFINRISPNIRWTDLDDLCTSAHLTRVAASGEVHIQAFTRAVRLANGTDEPMHVSVVNHWARDTLASVSWNGRQVQTPDNATCRLQIRAREQGELRYHCSDTNVAVRVVDPTAADRMRVFVRRRLCEFRDNHVATSAALRPLARMIRPMFSRI